MRDHSRREEIEKAAIPSRGFHFGELASAAALFQSCSVAAGRAQESAALS
jgi:hypothetical protein